MQMISNCLLLLLSLYIKAVVSVDFTCQSLPPTYSPYTACSGIVDYPFYVPTGSSLETLDQQARNLMPFSILLTIGNPCLSHFKRQACAQVYLPCYPGALSNQPATYNPSTNLPYKKPCKSLCDILGNSQGCTLTQKFQFITAGLIFPSCAAATWDNSNNPLQCNTLSTAVTSAKVVSDDVEDYIGETCHGLVSKIYIPFAKAVNETLAPLLPPYAMQKWLEDHYGKQLNRLPHTFNEDCIRTARKLLCATMFIHPGTFDVKLLGFTVQTVNVPNFPTYDNCMHYKRACEPLFKYAAEANINCSKSVDFSGITVHSYPVGTQLIGYINPAMKSGEVTADAYNIDMMPTPNYTTVCPRGFSLADKNDKGNLMTTDSCAINCPSEVFPPEGQSLQTTALSLMNWINVIVGIGALINLFIQPKEKKNLLLIIATIALLTYAFYDALQRMFVGNVNKLVCAGKTPYHVLDMMTSTTPETGENESLARNCQVYAMLVVYAEFIFYSSILALFAEVYYRRVIHYDITPYRIYYLPIVYLYGIGNGILVNLLNNPKMVTPGTPTTSCALTTGDAMTDFVIRYLPHIVIYGVCFFMSFGIFTKWEIYWKKNGQKFQDMWSEDNILLMYTAAFIGFYGPILFFSNMYFNLYMVPALVKVITEWGTCIFTNFITEADQDKVDQLCGKYPKIPFDTSSFIPVFGLSLLFNIVVFCITLDKFARKYWYKHIMQLCGCNYIDEDEEDHAGGINDTDSQTSRTAKSDKGLLNINTLRRLSSGSKGEKEIETVRLDI